MTLVQWLLEAEGRLGFAGIEDARLEARVLAGFVLEVDRPYLVAHAHDPIDPAPFESALVRRLQREPLAHIVGFREFYGRPFRVNRHVLIPRQETELLVDETLRRIDLGGARVLDVGAGTGCIGITLKLERPSWAVTLADLSPEALVVAGDNAHDLGATVEIVQGDLFGGLHGRIFDVVVSNPPYISEGTPLMPEVGLFEPELALYGGETGYEVYDRLAVEALPHVASPGFVLLEVGMGQAEDVADIFASAGWRGEGIVADLAGIPRVVVLSK